MSSPEIRDITLDETCALQVLDAVQMTVHFFAEVLSNAIDIKFFYMHNYFEEITVMVQTVGRQIGLFAKPSDTLHVAGYGRSVARPWENK